MPTTTTTYADSTEAAASEVTPTVGTVVCVENVWIKDCELEEITHGGGYQDVGTYVIYTAGQSDMLTLDRQLGQGTYGKVYRYSSVMGKECVLKVLTSSYEETPSIDRGGIGHAKYVEATMNAEVCAIAYTKFFSGGRLQVMELGTVCTESFTHHESKPLSFMKFIGEVCTCLLENSLANPDMKLENVMSVQCASRVDVEFRLIDVDGIVACGLEKDLSEYASKYKSELPDVLFVETAATFPIISNADLQCPIMLMVQTWYASLVTCLLAVQYYKHSGISPMIREIYNKCRFDSMEQYKYLRYGIMSDKHPFAKLLKRYGPDEVPVIFVEYVQKFIAIFPKWQSNAQMGNYRSHSSYVKGCDKLYTFGVKHVKARGESEIEAETKEDKFQKGYQLYQEDFVYVKGVLLNMISEFYRDVSALHTLF